MKVALRIVALPWLVAGFAAPGQAATTSPIDRTHKEAVLCLALNGYHEARGQSARAELMVNQVVLNRLEDDRFPRTACAVVKQQAGPGKCQFSWVCDRNSDQPRDAEAFSRSVDLASALLNRRETLPDLTEGALFFTAKTSDRVGAGRCG